MTSFQRPGLGRLLPAVVLATALLPAPAPADRPGNDAAASTAPAVATLPASPLGNDAMTVNGTVQPHGLYTTYYFEYGPTTGYGMKTPARPLPPRLAAYYHETWDEGLGNWSAVMRDKERMTHHRTGGASGGFVRFSEPSIDDPNHVDGIGTLHLASYVYPGSYRYLLDRSLFLGGGNPDLRDARVSLYVRGNGWVPNGSELVWWTQSQLNPAAAKEGDERFANWAYTGFYLNDFLRSGKWEKVEYRLLNDTEKWSYGGNNVSQNRPTYTYWSIDKAQADLNADFFHLLACVDPKNQPKGSIDFDEFDLAYRNYSLLLPSNGGKLLRPPAGSPDDPAALTDGWRHGQGHTWRSAANPSTPLEFVYAFKDPVTIRTVQLHQNPEWPARAVEVLVSPDDRSYTALVKRVLPEKGKPNANFAFTVDRNLSARASYLKVRVTSGYKKEHWGLGEVEVFGTGATMLPDDDLYHVNTDILGLRAGETYHYRLVATGGADTTRGDDRTFTVPADKKPHLRTTTASRVTATSARVEGRLSPLGLRTRFYFEYGPDTRYGSKSAEGYAGLQVTPRSVFTTLTGLKPGTRYHYRLVGVNEAGTAHGGDAVFETPDR